MSASAMVALWSGQGAEGSARCCLPGSPTGRAGRKEPAAAGNNLPCPSDAFSLAGGSWQCLSTWGSHRGGCPSGTRCFHPCFSPALPLRWAPHAREPCMCTKMCASSARAARLGSGVSKRLFSERFLEGRCDEQFKAQADRINQARPVAAFGRRWISPRGSDDTCC